MARHEDIQNSIWSDPEWLELTPRAKLLYLWTWTNPRCGMAGIYKVSLSVATVPETGLDLEQVREALDELRAARFCFYETQVLFVRSRVKRLRQQTDQIAKAICNDLEMIPSDHPLRAMFLSEYGHYVFLHPYLEGDPPVTLTGASNEPQAFGSISQIRGGSSEGRSTLYGNGNGNGNGKGKEKGGPGGKTNGGIDWGVWCDRHVPELPPTFAISAARALHAAGIDVEPDTVRRRVHAQHDWTADEGESS